MLTLALFVLPFLLLLFLIGAAKFGLYTSSSFFLCATCRDGRSALKSRRNTIWIRSLEQHLHVEKQNSFIFVEDCATTIPT